MSRYAGEYKPIEALGLEVFSGYCGNPVVDADQLEEALNRGIL